MTAEWDSLRALAENATQGEWKHDDAGEFSEVHGGWDNRQVACNVDWDDAAFIAAANPATVLALLDQIAELEDERDERDRVHEKWCEYRATLDRVRALADEWTANCDHRGTCDREDCSDSLRAALADVSVSKGQSDTGGGDEG